MITPRRLVVLSLDFGYCENSVQKRLHSEREPKVIHRFTCVLFAMLTLAVACSLTHAARNAGIGRASGLDAPVTINLMDYGAVGDGVADDGPALQNALEALADAGGGNLFVPDGRYAIVTPVSVDFSNRATAVVMRGTPSSSPDNGTGDYGRGLNLSAEFLIKASEANDAIKLRSLTTLRVENLVFIGDLAVMNDARVVLSLSAINSSTIDYCEFYGLGTFVADGAVVYEQGGALEVTRSAFLGCGGNSGTSTSIVQVYAWTGLSVTDTRFVDYGTRPDYYSKTTIMSPFSWISVGGAAPLTNLSPRRDVTVRDVLLDEGAYYALSVRPGLFPVANGGAISSVYLSNLYVNVTNLGEVGVRIHYVDNVFIEHSHFGWSHNSRGAMQLAYVKNAILNQIECVLSANTIIADETVAEVSVVNSVYDTLDSQAPVTRVITTPNPEDGPAEYVKQKYLEVLGHEPDIPGYVYWSQQRARCNNDSQCTTDEELLAYLAGNPAPTFSITGRLVDSQELPIAAATVSLSGTHAVNTLTDGNGEYSFSELATSGEYTITPSRTFYTFNASGSEAGVSSRSFIAPLGNQIADFTGTLASYSIQGRVNDWQVQSLGDATITLTGGPAGFQPQSQNTTNAGDYFFTSLPAGYNYVVSAAKDFYTFAPNAHSLVLEGATVNLDFIGTPITHSIRGRVTDGMAPLAEATVTISGDASRSTTSDVNGEYGVDELIAGGTYTVMVTKRHYTFANQTVTNLLSDSTVDFAGDRVRYTITGAVSTSPNGLDGVLVTLGGDQTATVVTNSSGGYAFTAYAGGNYTLTAVKEGYVFVPPSYSFNDLDQNVYPSFTAVLLPVLLAQETTNRAIAFNSISLLREPFDLFTTPFDFSPDRRTRVVLFARLGTEPLATITAVGEDSVGHIFPLLVEFAGPLSDVSGVTQLNVRLDSQLATGGDVRITIAVNGLNSNGVVVKIK